jgi:Rhodopirellula transposase DDE domain
MVLMRDIRKKLRCLWPHLNERSRRMLAASEATQIGYGGVSLVSRACGLSRVTITKGISELASAPLPVKRIRRPGGGRQRLTVRDPKLPGLLESLVEPSARGDPESPLRWTCKSTRTLAKELSARRHPISHEKVAQLLRDMDYSLQGVDGEMILSENRRSEIISSCSGVFFKIQPQSLLPSFLSLFFLLISGI